ncbi:hypothetical protein ACTHQ7_04285 [Microbacterium enclense]
MRQIAPFDLLHRIAALEDPVTETATPDFDIETGALISSKPGWQAALSCRSRSPRDSPSTSTD